MSLRVDDEILRSWQAQVDEGHDAGLSMRLASPAPVGDTLRAVASAVRHAVVDRQTEDFPFRGEWSWVRAGDDVIVTVDKCEVLPEVLTDLAAALEGQGIGGSLELHEPETPPFQWPWPVRLLEARLRVRGEAEHIGGPTYHWHADPEALERAMGAAVRWCVEGLGPKPWLRGGLNPIVETPSDGLAERVREEMDGAAVVEVRRGTRGVVVDALWGRVALIEVDERWRRALPPIVGVLREAAGALAYAFVKSGADVSHVVAGESLEYDWPPRDDAVEPVVQPTAAFEAEYAPDAFAVQILGPGYAGRMPAARLFRAECVADCTLLEHVDLPSWFDEPLVPPGTDWTQIEQVTPPPVLAEARAELAPILLGASR